MIFISHNRLDEEVAKKIASYLIKQHNMEVYLDVYDGYLEDADDITSRLISKIKESQNVLAVFSPNTVESAWVPFELGAAYISGKGIATIKIEKVCLPEYLDAFPILNYSYVDMDHFANYAKKFQKHKVAALNESKSFPQGANQSKLFISGLKKVLDQK